MANAVWTKGNAKLLKTSGGEYRVVGFGLPADVDFVGVDGEKRNTCPGALMRPMIWLGSPPTTRLSVTEDADGWLKLTRASLPTLKLFQSIAARLLLWLMLRVLPVALMLALPPTTLPPLGNWLGAGAVCALANPIHKHAAARATRCGVKRAVYVRMV